MAEADGNRTRLTRVPGHIGFEDRGGHQAPTRLRGESRFSTDDAMTRADPIRLTQYAHGGGCACKIPPGELESIVAGLTGPAPDGLIVGLDDGDDAAVVRLDGDRAGVATADFFTPVLDDAYDWGRVAAANALPDIYAMGG